MTSGVSLTTSAAKHILRQLEVRGGGIGIRLGVRPAGCSGFAYVLEFVDLAEEQDEIFEEHGVTMFIDPKSLAILEGTELHFAREGLNEGLEFKNPNVSAECGCGESFTI